MERDPLILRNQEGRLAYYRKHEELLRALVEEGQSPEVLLIACSDSRIVNESLIGARPGEVFTVRSVGAVVPSYGTGQRSVGAALEFSLGSLSVAHVVVCGHNHCGAIMALDSGLDQQRFPNLTLWLEHLRPAKTSVDGRHSFDEPAARHLAIVEQSVLLSLRNLETYPLVRNALQKQTVRLHGWVHDLETGRLSYYDAARGRFVREDEL